MDNVQVEIRKSQFTCDTSHMLSQIPHLHKEIEIVYVKNGKVSCYANRHSFSLTEGDIFIAFPNQIHYYVDCSPGDYPLFIVSPDVLWNCKKTMFEYKPTNNRIHRDKSAPFLNLIEQIFEQNGEYCDMIRVGLFNQLMGMILGELTLKPQINSDKATIQSILNYCAENFSDSITLEDVAAALHLNKYHISHLLNKKLGISFSTYINSLRIEHACTLLMENKQSIADISEEVGFGSIRTFNRAFSRIMHMTPLEYRKQISTPQQT